jgi:hypothetical protein
MKGFLGLSNFKSSQVTASNLVLKNILLRELK